MNRLHIHDFYFESQTIENKPGENDFYYSVNIYYNFSANPPGDGWDDLEYFNIQVANPYGLAKYLKNCIAKGLFSQSFFYPHVYITEINNKDIIMKEIRDELMSISGKSKNALILKAIRKFGWESEGIPDVYERLFEK